MSRADNHIPAAAGLIFVAMVVIGYIDNYVRVIASEAGLWQFHLIRSAMVFAILFPVGMALGRRFRPVRTWAVAVRSLLTATGIFVYFWALSLLPIATVGAGLFTAPIWVLVYSIVLFGDRVGPIRVVAVMVGFVGVLLILRPTAEGLTWAGVLPILAGMLYAAGALATRKLCADETTETLLAGFFTVLATYGAFGTIVLLIVGGGGSPETAGFFLTGWQEPTQTFLSLTLLQAVGSLIAVYCIIRAYQVADASYVAVFEYSFLLSAGAWGYLLWRELPDLPALIGIGCILISGTLIILRSRTPLE